MRGHALVGIGIFSFFKSGGEGRGRRVRHLDRRSLRSDLAPQKLDKKAKIPLVIFSHGHGGSAVSARGLMRAIAASGYWVVAPNHRDAILHWHHGMPRPPRQQPFERPARWTDSTYRDRDEDLKRLWKGLLAHPPVGVDLSRIALVGHSLGGYTVLCAAGARPSWVVASGRVRAVLALSPYLRPLHDRQLLSRLTVPVEFQSGTQDRPGVRFLRSPFGAYDQVRAPKAYVEITGANHLSWCDYDRDAQRHALINRYAIGFLNRYLKKRGDGLFGKALPGVSDLRVSP